MRIIYTIVGRFAPGREPIGWDGRDPVAYLWEGDTVTFVCGRIVWSESWPSNDPEGLRERLEKDWGEARIVR